MKKKIAIFGSTGSIGKNLINLITKNKNEFEVVLLTAHKNINLLLKQAKILRAKNIIITDKKKFNYLKLKKFNFNIYQNFENLNKIFRNKIDYVMSSITGLDGLEPTIKSIKHTKKIAIANKESLICAWNLIENELKKNNTEFVPVDSEHFSIWCCLNSNDSSDVNDIFITASGGPFLDLPLSKFRSINVEDAIKHPNWNMGKKISVDSSTMMNKVFEVIEAKNIFNLSLKQIKILINRDSYLHAIVNFKNGITKTIIHDTDMRIPIFSTLYKKNKKIPHSNKLNLDKLNKLNLHYPDDKKFPMLNILKILPDKFTLFNTVIVSLNDSLVDLFLNRFINFQDISKSFYKILNSKKYDNYKLVKPSSINDIIKLKKIIQKEINSSYRSFPND